MTEPPAATSGRSRRSPSCCTPGVPTGRCTCGALALRNAFVGHRLRTMYLILIAETKAPEFSLTEPFAEQQVAPEGYLPTQRGFDRYFGAPSRGPQSHYRAPLRIEYILYSESLRKYTGLCENDSASRPAARRAPSPRRLPLRRPASRRTRPARSAARPPGLALGVKFTRIPPCIFHS